MKRLRAGINKYHTRHAWNAADGSEPIKWRRTVAERVPHWVASIPGGSKGALNASKSAHTFDFHIVFGCLEVVTSSMVHMLMALRPVALYNANLGPWRVRKCPIGWAPAGRPSSVRISHIFIFKPFDRVFLLYLAAQL